MLRGALLIALVGPAIGACELLANIPDYQDKNGAGDGGTGDGSSGGDGGGGDGGMAECEMSTECSGLEVCVAGGCQLCDRDAHCGDAAASACLPDGTCAGPARMAFAAPNGTGAACSQAMPCDIAQAFQTAASSPTIDIVKLGPGTYNRTDQISVGTDTVTVAGEGATLMGTANFLHVTDGSLTIVGVTMHGTSGQFNALCFASAATGKLALHRVTTRGGGYGFGGFGCDVTATRTAVLQNTAIGAYVQGGSARVSNSVFVGNGVGGGAAGGLMFINIANPRVELSTFAGNVSAANENGGAITCSGATGNVVTSSVLWGNTGTTLIDPACNVSYSVVELAFAGGVSNVRQDPLFVAAGDHHLQATSPARGAGDPAITNAVDFDNQARPQGGGAVDSGADELP